MAHIEVNSERCKSCQLCISACPKNVIAVGKKVNSKGYEYIEAVNDNCIGCMSCGRICPEGAINVYK